VVPEDKARWDALRARIQKGGLRNSLMIAIAPTATIASIAGCYECIEPQVSNLFKRETLSGDFLQVNKYLVREMQVLGLWNDSMRSRLKMSEGSVQEFTELPEDVRAIYRTAWEIPMRSLIDMAADRGAFIDQSQSLNLFVEAPNIGKLSSMYFYAWQKGLKTTYYMRSRPATRIAKATVGTQAGSNLAPTPTMPMAHAAPAPAPVVMAMPEASVVDAEAVACSLENPESCEACQ
jgi:ribonucleoside-diphosphate reductase alpha chain